MSFTVPNTSGVGTRARVCNKSASSQVEFELKEYYSITVFAAATAHGSVPAKSLENEAIYWYAPVIAAGCVLL